MNNRVLPPDPGIGDLHLTAAQLERIAAGEPAITEACWLNHLDDCELCRQQLADIAADESFWRESSILLRSFDSDDEALGAPEDKAAADDGPADEAITLVVRSLLAPTERDDSIGRLGRFEVLGIVGSGGMGIVLKCRDVDIDRVVAVKIPSVHLWRSPAALETLEREARSAASVVHRHVIAIYQVDRWREVPYLVMPYFPGPSLDRRIHRSGPLQLAEAVRITRQMAEALAAAHTCGVIHRDVKPGNILLGRGVERAVLSDFGLAKVQSDATYTASGLVAGTPSYLSPEQATGKRVGPASDLFSLGSVFWTMLTGDVPWAGMHPHAIVSRIACGELPPMHRRQDDLPPWVFRLLGWMHQVDPSDRPASAEEFAEQLKACERHMTDPESHPLPQHLSPGDLAGPDRRRRRYVSIAGVIGVLLAVSLLSLPLLPFDDRPAVPAGDRPLNMPRGTPVQKPDDPAAANPPVASSDESPRTEISPESVTPMLDDIEASVQQILSELQALEDSNR